MKPSMHNLHNLLYKLVSCGSEAAWIYTCGTAYDAWRCCPGGHDLVWFLAKLGLDRKRIVWIVCQQARLAEVYGNSNDSRPLEAIKAAEDWTRGKITVQDVCVYASAAYDAAHTSQHFDDRGFAYAAASAAMAVSTVTTAAFVADYAAGISTPALRKEILLNSAKIVRKNVAWKEVKQLMENYK